MAASDARPVPRKNAAYRVYFPILDNDGDLVSSAAGLDSEVSTDGAAFADCTNEAAEIGSSGMYFLDLTSTEMNADCVVVIVKTTTADAKTTPLVLYPEEAGDVRVNVTAIGNDPQSMADLKDFVDAGYDPASHKVQGVVVVDTTTANTDMRGTDGAYTGTPPSEQSIWQYATRTLSAFAFEVTTDVASREASKANVSALATAAALGVVDGNVDAIKAKTDNLPASPAAVGSAMTLTAGERNSVADAVLARNVSNVEVAAGEHTLCTIVLAMLESAVAGTTWTIKRTDGETTHAVKTVTTDADAEPITGVT